jgi:hypothetical protein
MLTKNITELFVRDLKKLKEEISLYKNETDLWKIEKEIKNSAGNLALHLVGNLNHFIGTQLGNTGYVRQRDREFSDKNVSREKILLSIDEVIAVVQKTLSRLKDEDLNKEYPIEFLNKKLSTGELLLQIITHFSYHLGQINYHRRLLG